MIFHHRLLSIKGFATARNQFWPRKTLQLAVSYPIWPPSTFSFNESFFSRQLVELKEAEQKSLKESERLEKEIAEVQEMKVWGRT